MEVDLILLGKRLIIMACIAMTYQSHANQLQTAFGIHYTTPKTLAQSSNGQSDVASQDISPYGQIQNANNAAAEVDQSTNALNFDQNPFFYGSGYYDSESGLQYMGARYYSTKLGMFVAQDSYNIMNRYQYANANPIMYADPDGHLAWGFLPDSWSSAIGMMIGIGFGMGTSIVLVRTIKKTLSTVKTLALGAIEGGFSGGISDFTEQGILYHDEKKAFNFKELLLATVSSALASAVMARLFRPSMKQKIDIPADNPGSSELSESIHYMEGGEVREKRHAGKIPENKPTETKRPNVSNRIQGSPNELSKKTFQEDENQKITLNLEHITAQEENIATDTENSRESFNENITTPTKKTTKI